MSHSFAEALRLMHTNYVDGLLILAAAVGVGQPLTQPMDQLASATALNDVGIELRAQGRYGDAERVFRQALEIRQMLLPGAARETRVAANSFRVIPTACITSSTTV